MNGRRSLALVLAVLTGLSCGGAQSEGPTGASSHEVAPGPSGPAPSASEAPAEGPSASASPGEPAPPIASAEPAEGAPLSEGQGGEPQAASEANERWCAPEFEALSGEVCVFAPSREMTGPRTLVVFLHGVVAPGTTWQWGQQRAAARAAKAHGFTVLMPRGQRGKGPKGMSDAWAWPGAASPEIEAEVLAIWQKARAEIEGRDGRRFERVWVFGFSSGAYYATSLALRGRLAGAAQPHIDGFAAFAGGGGKSSAIEQIARRAKVRTPLFVGWGGKDRSRDDPMKLAALLRKVGWPSKGELSPKAGHAMTDAQVTSAVRFLGAQRSGPGDKARAARR
jgi:pimeloyl-ACP methyl ester carboxylesterase